MWCKKKKWVPKKLLLNEGFKYLKCHHFFLKDTEFFKNAVFHVKKMHRCNAKGRNEFQKNYWLTEGFVTERRLVVAQTHMKAANLLHPDFVCLWFRVFEKRLTRTFQTSYLFLNFSRSGEILPLNAVIEFFSQFVQLQSYSGQLRSSRRQNRHLLENFALFEIAQLICTKCKEYN